MMEVASFFEVLSLEVMIWIGGGILLALMEFFIPGLFVVFLGIAAIIVGLLIQVHWIQGIYMSVITWIVLSVFLILTIRRFAAKYFLSDEEYKYTEEDDDAIGQVVTVTQTIHSADTNGRIRFRGTEWPARSEEEIIEKDSYAVIKYRDNISWVVQKTGGKI